MLNQFLGNRWFVLLVNKSSQVSILPTTSEKETWSKTTKTQWYCSGLEQDVEEKRRRWWKTEGGIQLSNVQVRFYNNQREPWEVFNKLDSAAKINLASKYWDWWISIFIRPWKQHFVRKIPLTVYESGFDKNLRKSRKFWYRWTMYTRTPEDKMETQVGYLRHNFCCYAEQHPNGMHGLCLTRTFTEKRFC